MAGEYVLDTQAVVEVLRDGAPAVRDTQTVVEVLRDMTTTIYNTQCAIEVLRMNVDESSQPHVCIIC